CMPATCGDGIKDAAETDLDCGGPVCAQCYDRQRCNGGGNCLSGNCPAGVCVEAHCLGGTKDGNETDTDCGGPECARCTGGQACTVDDDCRSHFCDASTSTCNGGDCAD